METNTATATRFYIGLENQNGEIHPSEVIDYIQQFVEAGTFYQTKGLWQGETENSIVFEVMDFSRASEISKSELRDGLKTQFKQDSVMVAESQQEVAF